MKIKFIALLCLLIPVFFAGKVYSQDEEKIVYYQMEPYDDSLFIKIQEEVFIDPPDPKAEIIVDLRDVSNQTVSIKGVLYPFLAFTPETRARIITYPFKLNLLDEINFGSVFTRVIEKIKLNKLIEPPRKGQIISTMHYINPYFQFSGGERFGIPFKEDLGISFGFGTPYSAPKETNFIEGNFNILGFYIGGFHHLEDMFAPTQFKNALYAGSGYQVGYVIPFGNFFEINYQKVLINVPKFDSLTLIKVEDGTPMIMSGSYLNWEFRYPFRTLGATRAKVYVARYMHEVHIGFTGRELSVAGSTFDFRFDGLVKTNDRKKEYSFDILIQKIADSWGFSAFAIGPSIVLGRDIEDKFGITSFFVNARLKIGTSF